MGHLLGKHNESPAVCAGAFVYQVVDFVEIDNFDTVQFVYEMIAKIEL